MKMGTIIGAALVAGLLAVAAWFYIDSLRSELDLVNQELSHAQQEILDRDSVIHQLRDQERKNDLARAHLEGQRTSIQDLLNTRELQIRNLQRENDEYRNWAALAVPNPVARMRDHEALTGAAAYRERMSQGTSVPPAGGESGK